MVLPLVPLPHPHHQVFAAWSIQEAEYPLQHDTQPHHKDLFPFVLFVFFYTNYIVISKTNLLLSGCAPAHKDVLCAHNLEHNAQNTLIMALFDFLFLELGYIIQSVIWSVRHGYLRGSWNKISRCIVGGKLEEARLCHTFPHQFSQLLWLSSQGSLPFLAKMWQGQWVDFLF